MKVAPELWVPHPPIPPDLEPMAVFRETFLASLSPRHAGGIRMFAKPLFDLAATPRPGRHPRVRPIQAFLQAMAHDLGFLEAVVRAAALRPAARPMASDALLSSVAAARRLLTQLEQTAR